MNRSKFEIIEELMNELKEQMEFGEDDFSERLGKPKVEVVSMKTDDEMPMDDMAPESEDDKLKERIMQMRG